MKGKKLIKLTALHYKIKEASLEKYHGINENNARLLFNWERELELAKNVSGDYPIKPFIETFEFEEDDYNITEKDFRLLLKDIYYYKENAELITELTVTDGRVFTIKESIEEIDKFFEE